MQILSVGEAKARLRSWFPDREFFMRSEGQVRFITLSSRVQIGAALLAVALVLGWVVTLAGVGIARWSEARHRADTPTPPVSELRIELAEPAVDIAHLQLLRYKGHPNKLPLST